MVRTLHWYVSRELAKVTALALVGFTFIMTVFAIVEPLRKEGLASSQVLALFGYTLPVMLSLTLPIAALFAATIVYGRFSQDRELVACRASGISTFTILKPALVLGGIVTVISLALSNFVAPHLASLGERAVRANVKEILFHQLRTKNYVKFENHIIRADYVNASNDELGGVVYADIKKPNAIRIMVASTAFIKIHDYGDDGAYAAVHLINPICVQTNSLQFLKPQDLPVESLPLPNIAKEKPSFYDWGRLCAMLIDPSGHPEIERELIKIERKIGERMLADDVAGEINENHIYDKLGDRHGSYIIRATKAKVDDRGIARLSGGTDSDGKLLPVEVSRVRDGNVEQIITADSGKVQAKWTALTNTSLVTIKLSGPTLVRLAVENFAAGPSRDGWDTGQIIIPPDVQARIEAIRREDIFDNPEEVTSDPGIIAWINALRTERIPKLRLKIVAEMHGRISYGASCFLLVALGAALGILFRGGQVISAFAISVIPATLAIVMVLMGKELVVNPGVPVYAGLLAIWAGDLLLLGANVYVYARLLRT